MIRVRSRLVGGDSSTANIECIFVDESPPPAPGIRSVRILDRNGVDVPVQPPSECPPDYWVTVSVPITALPVFFEAEDCDGTPTPRDANDPFLPPIGDPTDPMPSFDCSPLRVDCSVSNPACDEAMALYNRLVSSFVATCRRCRGLLEEHILHAALAAAAFVMALVLAALAAVMFVMGALASMFGVGVLLFVVGAALVAASVAAFTSFANETRIANELLAEHHACNARAQELREEVEDAEDFANRVCCGCAVFVPELGC